MTHEFFSESSEPEDYRLLNDPMLQLQLLQHELGRSFGSGLMRLTGGIGGLYVAAGPGLTEAPRDLLIGGSAVVALTGIRKVTAGFKQRFSCRSELASLRANNGLLSLEALLKTDELSETIEAAASFVRHADQHEQGIRHNKDIDEYEICLRSRSMPPADKLVTCGLALSLAMAARDDYQPSSQSRQQWQRQIEVTTGYLDEVIPLNGQSNWASFAASLQTDPEFHNRALSAAVNKRRTRRAAQSVHNGQRLAADTEML